MLIVTPNNMAVGHQVGGLDICFAEVTFTGSGYSIGTLFTRSTSFFQGLTSPPLIANPALQLSVIFAVPLTNYAISGLSVGNMGFRISKNGNSLPIFDIYNSLFCTANTMSLHANLGSMIFSIEKASPSKAMLFDYTITGAGPASVQATATYTSLIEIISSS